jgi:hypothetical protein
MFIVEYLENQDEQIVKKKERTGVQKARYEDSEKILKLGEKKTHYLKRTENFENNK